MFLPIVDERPVSVEMTFEAPHEASRDADSSNDDTADSETGKNGVYFGEKRLAELKPGFNKTSFVVEPTSDDVKRGKLC